MSGRMSKAGGYSLIELLVVVGLIVLLAGGIGFALGDSGGNSLATAQTTLATAVNLARAQAAVNQTEAIVAIYGTRPPAGDPDKYLRFIQVFRNTTPGTDINSATWLAVGSPVSLPRGVYVVPNSTAGLLAANVVWPANPPALSSVTSTSITRQPVGTAFSGGTTTAFVVEFKADGTVTQVGTQAHARLVVATATVAANGSPTFNNENAIRGVLLRPSGTLTFANDRLGL